MIDIHCHILPMIDDGAKSVEMALDMLDAAYRDGTDEIVLTPHLAYEYNFVNPKDKIIPLFEDLTYIVKREGIPIKMYLGTEYLFSSPSSFLEHKNDIRTMNGTQYLLTEFFFDVREEEVLEAIDLVLEHGWIPIIAHAERFECMQISSSLPIKAIEKGALLQLNKASVLGKHGHRAKECAFYFLDHHYYSFVGSDAHHPVLRDSKMFDAYRVICDYYGRSYANRIFYENPSKMLDNVDIRKREKDEEK